MNKKIIMVWIYSSEIATNPQAHERISKAWIMVPEEWAEQQARYQGFNTLEDFLDEYTFDHTVGWLQQATDEGVLLACAARSIFTHAD